MKKSNFNPVGFLFAFLMFALIVNTAFTYHPPGGHDNLKKVTSVTPAETVSATVVHPFLMPLDVATGSEMCKPSVEDCYAIVPDDAKPDNTNFQLIRAKQLKLHRATDSKAV